MPIQAFSSKTVLDDILAALEAGWEGDRYGVIPMLSKVYDRNSFGLGTNVNENIVVYADSESVEPFGLGGRDWMHTLQVSITVNTDSSEDRFDLLAGAVRQILYDAITPEGYVWWKVRGFTNLSHKGRNYWAGVVDLEVRVKNPMTAAANE